MIDSFVQGEIFIGIFRNYFSLKFRLQYIFIKEGCLFVGPYPHKDYHIGSKFCKFYFIRINFKLGDLVFLVEMFRLFKLKWVFWCSKHEHNRWIKQENLGIFLSEKVMVAIFWVLKFVVEVLGLCDEPICYFCSKCCCFCCYHRYTPSSLLACMSSSPPTITIAIRNNSLFIVCCAFMLYTRKDKK